MARWITTCCVNAERQAREAKAQRVPETQPRNAFWSSTTRDNSDLGDWLNDLVARLRRLAVRVTRVRARISFLIAHAPEKLAAEPPALGVAPVAFRTSSATGGYAAGGVLRWWFKCVSGA